jgi:hypothetical protein
MRIVYLIKEDLEKNPGLKYKIQNQIKFWQSQGHKVYQVLLLERIVIDQSCNQTCKNENATSHQEGKLNMFKKIYSQYNFACSALKVIKPDLTYSRYLFPVPNVRSISKYAGKMVFEINSNDRSEFLLKNKLTGIYNALFRSLSLKNSDGLVFVTEELACSSLFKGYCLKSATIANGVNKNDFNFLRKTNNKNPQLVFIGSPNQAWQGLDKIQQLSQH